MEAAVLSKGDKTFWFGKYIYQLFVGTYRLHLQDSTNMILTTETAPKETVVTRIGTNTGWGL